MVGWGGSTSTSIAGKSSFIGDQGAGGRMNTLRLKLRTVWYVAPVVLGFRTLVATVMSCLPTLSPSIMKYTGPGWLPTYLHN
jgi:hypothetical protein